MSDINPEIMNGEPVCSSNCPGTFTIALRYLTVSPAQNCPYQKPGAPCIPALRQQRDDAIARAEKAENRVSDLEATVEHLNEKADCAEIVRNSMVERLGASQEWVCSKCCRVYTFETTKRTNGFPRCPVCDTFCTTKHTYETDRLKKALNNIRSAVEGARGGTSFDHANALGEIDELLKED